MSVIPFGWNAGDHVKVEGESVEAVRSHLRDLGMPHSSDETILCFLMGCGRDVEQAKKYAAVQYVGRRALPEVFLERSVSACETVTRAWRAMEVGAMRERTDAGDAVIVFRLRPDVATGELQTAAACKLLVMILDSVLHEEPVPGFVLLIDLEHLRLGHIARIQLGVLARMLRYACEGLLTHLTAVHFVNGGRLTDQLFRLFRTFGSRQLMQLFVYHSRGVDWQAFYDGCIPRRCLPSEYGGEDEPMQLVHERTYRRLADLQLYFDKEVEYRANYEGRNTNTT